MPSLAIEALKLGYGGQAHIRQAWEALPPKNVIFEILSPFSGGVWQVALQHGLPVGLAHFLENLVV